MALVCVLLSGCEPATPGLDASVGLDAGLDAGASGEVDAGVDAGRDAAMDLDAGLDAGAPVDAAPDAPLDASARCAGPPGLYTDGSCSALAPGVRPYHPRYALWSDATDKERFVYLPPGSQIDTTNPDRWGFPVGARLYKTFSRDGRRLETRLLEKTAPSRGPSSWRMVSYLWSEDGNSVSEVGAFGAVDVLGTTHDVPTRAACIRCHSVAQDDAADGFSALQLAHDEGGVTLAALNAEGWLTTPIDPGAARLPGDATAQAALGYLHANCGNCHGGPAPEHGLDYWQTVGATDDVTLTPAYRTSVCGCSVWSTTSSGGEVANLRVAPGHPELSVSLLRMQTRMRTDAMPPIGSEVIDLEGVRVVSEWIASLPGDANGCPHGCPWP